MPAKSVCPGDLKEDIEKMVVDLGLSSAVSIYPFTKERHQRTGILKFVTEVWTGPCVCLCGNPDAVYQLFLSTLMHVTVAGTSIARASWINALTWALQCNRGWGIARLVQNRAPEWNRDIRSPSTSSRLATALPWHPSWKAGDMRFFLARAGVKPRDTKCPKPDGKHMHVSSFNSAT